MVRCVLEEGAGSWAVNRGKRPGRKLLEESRKNDEGVWGYSSVVQCLPRMHEFNVQCYKKKKKMKA
jgi:hypothetical protein